MVEFGQYFAFKQIDYPDDDMFVYHVWYFDNELISKAKGLMFGTYNLPIDDKRKYIGTMHNDGTITLAKGIKHSEYIIFKIKLAVARTIINGANPSW